MKRKAKVKAKVTVFGHSINNPILKSFLLVLLPIWLLLIGLITAPIFIPVHFVLRWRGLKGIYFVDGHFMDTSRNSFRPRK